MTAGGVTSGGFGRRTVPKFQREPMRDREDNYIDNMRRHPLGGNPNLTDETDIFDRLNRETDEETRRLQERQSIDWFVRNR